MSVTFDEYMTAHTWPNERFVLKVNQNRGEVTSYLSLNG